MGFFLLGRGREAGELRLISTEVYSGRSEAVEALTKLSGEPGFAHYDAEVFVLDLDTGMPVVLVAPSAPVVEAPAEEPVEEVAEEVAEETADAGVWEAPAEEVEPAIAEAVEAELVAEEPEAEPEPEPEPEAEPEPEPEAAEEPEAEPEPEPVTDDFAEIVEAITEDEVDDLAGALKRAAGALESEGIVAPESIGPAPTDAAEEGPVSVFELEAEFEPAPVEPEAASPSTPEAAWPWDTGAASADAEPPVAEPASEAEPEPAIEPVPVAEPEPESAIEPEPAADVPAYVPDPFEEPAADAGDFLKVQIGDDSSAMGRTVVMGAYAEESEPVAEDAPVQAADTEIDSMLADLGAVSADASGGSDLSSLTCEDCVYVNTCPNKEGMDPSKCGNFQWRSV